MNSVQRRLFRAFVETGGDLSEDGQVEGFIRYVESNLLLLPPKVREAVELVWREPDAASYERGARVSAASLRQRVSRGARLLEGALRHRPGGSQSLTARGNGGLRRAGM